MIFTDWLREEIWYLPEQKKLHSRSTYLEKSIWWSEKQNEEEILLLENILLQVHLTQNLRGKKISTCCEKYKITNQFSSSRR